MSFESNNARQVNFALSEEDHNMICWLGQQMAGQVFQAQGNGFIKSVSVLPEVIGHDGELVMTLHRFNPETKIWEAVLAQAAKQITTGMADQWQQFSFDTIQVAAGQWYGFKLQYTGGQLALAEGARKNNGNKSMEWTALNAQEKGVFHSDFHLAYKVALAA